MGCLLLRYALLGAIATLSCCDANADCILNAKSKSSYVILDSHTVLLQGGLGQNILIKSIASMTDTSQVTVLKDNFCDFESAVLYIDGEAVDAQQVRGMQ